MSRPGQGSLVGEGRGYILREKEGRSGKEGRKTKKGRIEKNESKEEKKE
jgi:hypothetical protein